MEDRTWTTEMHSFDQSPVGSEAKKRPTSSDGRDEPMRKMPVTKFGSRPRFEPVHFVSGGSCAGTGTDEKENDKERRKSDWHGARQWDSHHSLHSGRTQGFSSLRPAFDRVPPCSNDFWGAPRDGNGSPGSTSGLGYGGHGPSLNYMAKMQQNYTAKYEAHTSSYSLDSYSKPQRYNGYVDGSRTNSWDSGRQGLGYGHQGRPFSRAYSRPSTSSPNQSESAKPLQVSHSMLEEKQRLITSVANALSVGFRNPLLMTGSDSPNYNFMLSRSIQACKTNPEYIYVNLKDIPQADLPKNRKVPTDGYACELRCQGVYLATGYSGSKNGARDRASEQAVKLLLKPVEVRVVQRKHRHSLVSDMVVCQMHGPTPAFLPALRNPEDKTTPSPKSHLEPDLNKHWTEFVVMDNAHDAICILNNSNAFNRMKIDYEFVQLPSNLWQCNIFLQDELIAKATGTKKSSKHAAAEEAVRKLRLNQAQREHWQKQTQHLGGNNQPDPGDCFGQQSDPACSFGPQGVIVRKKHLSELVILENSDNAICIINDTAQFNKVSADYRFSVLPDHRWRCEVFLEGQYVAAGIGPKKIVKHIAAQEALATLRQTQAVVKSNLRKEGHNDAISRSQILAHSGEEALKQEIKEDNIGNQLLRKMGWKGGGLGRDGEGIAEPIRVKEQFSREGLGMEMDKMGNQLRKRDIEDIIRNYASSDRTDDLRFSNELTNDERKQIHQISQKYGLRSKSYGQGRDRFLVVSRKVHKDQLIGQLLQEGQVGRYELIKPQASH
ncbi:NF-kappa-B-repressing factor [Cyprinodon tularosa]|uniref:NF-kappa-B-repressing factor n=1 Tax=Cyprinodon tularosa TaxID=77115 RepID=UPI0018E1FB18|nr:NF-kappa-B-repressing factor [Cyprinodon tularosa]XP_038145380.1 NF-kappa-B-repressing factor [Cyprinodon tularosa]XP_038145382.1 NF-kappa-B-repressing factor [Cyprinodon tularosa]XP_038145383.1 NF-kappa-B-repressing factor [Cyprinodon tularosa]XP_038145384.1 NF-kappa-B-repressing factor [Cyprinodon tularosa]XP_038145385.1 NF-kappa-B-repressing factor [Cyprinodon tularosa]XP_038145386.1 NF-kappa-B-repressing factor [Cyprinodon tularosa]